MRGVGNPIDVNTFKKLNAVECILRKESGRTADVDIASKATGISLLHLVKIICYISCKHACMHLTMTFRYYSPDVESDMVMVASALLIIGQ